MADTSSLTHARVASTSIEYHELSAEPWSFEVRQPCCSRISAKSRSTLHRVTLIAAEFGCVAHANHNVASSGPGIGQRAL